MANQNTRKYYVTKSGLGYEEGVYTAEEIAKLPKGATQKMIPLSVALAQHLVEADYSSSDSISTLTLSQAIDPKTGKLKNVRGVEESKSIKKSIFSAFKTDDQEGRLNNNLQTKISDLKAKKAEDSLKAQIAAKKKQLAN